jgi:hypothetical protein
VQELEATLVARAFGSLPGRWQTVLWHIEVEGDSPGAAAALSGLLFVATSINIQRIMTFPTLPTRAAGSLVLFAFPLLAGICLLIQDQSIDALGAELLVAGLACAGALLWLHRPSRRAAPDALTSIDAHGSATNGRDLH